MSIMKQTPRSGRAPTLCPNATPTLPLVKEASCNRDLRSCLGGFRHGCGRNKRVKTCSAHVHSRRSLRGQRVQGQGSRGHASPCDCRHQSRRPARVKWAHGVQSHSCYHATRHHHGSSSHRAHRVLCSRRPHPAERSLGLTCVGFAQFRMLGCIRYSESTCPGVQNTCLYSLVDAVS